MNIINFFKINSCLFFNNVKDFFYETRYTSFSLTQILVYTDRVEEPVGRDLGGRGGEGHAVQGGLQVHWLRQLCMARTGLPIGLVVKLAC